MSARVPTLRPLSNLAARLLAVALALVVTLVGLPARLDASPATSSPTPAACCCGAAHPHACCAPAAPCCAHRPVPAPRDPSRDRAPAPARTDLRVTLALVGFVPAPIVTPALGIPALVSAARFGASPQDRRLHLRLAHFLE